ncbi:MAG: HTTM domain-containing protein [Actinomycetota bacterium]|nr:HTTM domain-containing protein [Actinomycetota bacterium]
MPITRIFWLRIFLYGFVLVDVLVTTSWVAMHGSVSPELYRPLWLARVFALPAPGPSFVIALKVALVVSAGMAMTGRRPRLTGSIVFLLYLEWMLIAFSYGKVNHDRVAFLVALAVLPTVGKAGREATLSEAAGWAIRCIQVAVVLTYFLAAYAKLRYGGIEWLNGATLLRAVLRRGTWAGDELRDFPLLLRAGQYALVAFELGSPLLLNRGRVGRIYLGLALAFHLVTWATLKISFLPHVICLLAFLPLESLHRPARLASPKVPRPAPS